MHRCNMKPLSAEEALERKKRSEFQRHNFAYTPVRFCSRFFAEIR